MTSHVQTPTRVRWQRLPSCSAAPLVGGRDLDDRGRWLAVVRRPSLIVWPLSSTVATAVGALILWRRPGHRMGRLLVTVGLMFAAERRASAPLTTAVDPFGMRFPRITPALVVLGEALSTAVAADRQPVRDRALPDRPTDEPSRAGGRAADRRRARRPDAGRAACRRIAESLESVASLPALRRLPAGRPRRRPALPPGDGGRARPVPLADRGGVRDRRAGRPDAPVREPDRGPVVALDRVHDPADPGRRRRRPALPAVRHRPDHQPLADLRRRERRAVRRVLRHEHPAPAASSARSSTTTSSPRPGPRCSWPASSSRSGAGSSGSSTGASTAPATTPIGRSTPSPAACATASTCPRLSVIWGRPPTVRSSHRRRRSGCASRRR